MSLQNGAPAEEERRGGQEDSRVKRDRVRWGGGARTALLSHAKDQHFTRQGFLLETLLQIPGGWGGCVIKKTTVVWFNFFLSLWWVLVLLFSCLLLLPSLHQAVRRFFLKQFVSPLVFLLLGGVVLSSPPPSPYPTSSMMHGSFWIHHPT